MIYFKDLARELGATDDELRSDLATWNVILRHQGKPEMVPGEMVHHFDTREFSMEWK